ncbi:hypothetical protein R1flu_015391 [Riccia fluitans]|uniref:Uncharacterized protein n=1 Tax=Riccia fluitans TaxID=41844 RepID=A0ABD1YJ84_9MARC
MNVHGVAKGGQESEQNVDEGVLFAGASSAFRNVHCSTFNALQVTTRATSTGRKPLNDISNRIASHQAKSANASPVAKRSRHLNCDMEILAQQIAFQVAHSKIANANKDALEHGSRMEPVSLLNKSAGSSQGEILEPEQRHLPKVLHKASGSEALKGKAPAMDNHTNGKSATYASKVAVSDHGALRQPDSRGRSADAWRAAREWRNLSLKAAVTSEECIRKNRDRFQRVNNGRMEENPYLELGQQMEMTKERRDEIRETFQFLRQTHDQTQGKVVRAIINAQQLSNRIQFLKEKTFVLYTVDISPSRDAILEWAEAVLHQEMGIRVLRVRVLNKHCYLITVENEPDRDRILDAAPLFLGPHMTLKKIEQACRCFVWGKNIQGRDKIPLLAWEVLQPAKGDGGLDIPSFALQRDSQKLRLILRMVHHPREDWMIALGALLKWKIDKGRGATSMRHWAVEEILMVNCPGRIQGARTATGLLRIWARARAELEIPKKEFTPQGESRVEVAITVGEQQGWLTAVEAKAIKSTLRRHKILTIGQWTDWAAWNDARRPLPWAGESEKANENAVHDGGAAGEDGRDGGDCDALSEASGLNDDEEDTTCSNEN